MFHGLQRLKIGDQRIVYGEIYSFYRTHCSGVWAIAFKRCFIRAGIIFLVI